MIQGHVSEALEPIVEIALVQAGVATALQAVVDTAFGDHVCLSDQHIERIDLTFKYVDQERMT